MSIMASKIIKFFVQQLAQANHTRLKFCITGPAANGGFPSQEIRKFFLQVPVSKWVAVTHDRVHV